MMFEGIALEHILEYFMGVIKVILSLFKIKVDDETSDNIGSMFDEIMGYQPEA